MKFRDLTSEQITEIAKLVYPFPDWIKSEITARYNPYDESHYEDAAEFWFATFKGITFGDTVDTYNIWIHPTLDVYMNAIRNLDDSVKYLGSFPVRNQRAIQMKFLEWNVEPFETNYRN